MPNHYSQESKHKFIHSFIHESTISSIKVNQILLLVQHTSHWYGQGTLESDDEQYDYPSPPLYTERKHLPKKCRLSNSIATNQTVFSSVDQTEVCINDQLSARNTHGNTLYIDVHRISLSLQVDGQFGSLGFIDLLRRRGGVLLVSENVWGKPSFVSLHVVRIVLYGT